MYSFSSASQMCEPLPRTMNGASPPTERNALTGEFTPPGIMLSARCCRRRDCSVLREVVDGIKSSRPVLSDNEKKMSTDRTHATEYYSSASVAEFIRYSSFCNPFATSHQYRKGHQVALLTGRV